MPAAVYDVFDEQRYFAPGGEQEIYEIAGERVALTICEDAWNDKSFWETRRYGVDPVEELMKRGADFMVNISASPYWRDKRATREEMLAAVAKRWGRPVVMVNQVGGNDSLLFDGGSFALDAKGNVAARAACCEEDVIFFDTQTGAGDVCAACEDEDEVCFRALAMGVRDYVRKTGFKKVLVGLSGGIDSALVAAIAVEALGAENVMGIGMPSAYSSTGSVEDSRALAQNLGIQFEIVPIRAMVDAFDGALAPLFGGAPHDLTEENLQARVRGTVLMACSNKWNALVLTTGNKSEIVGGLLHPVRRHGGGARGHWRRAQNRCLSAVALGEPQTRDHSRGDPDQAAFCGVASGAAPIPIRYPTMRIWTPYCRPTWNATRPRSRSPDTPSFRRKRSPAC